MAAEPVRIDPAAFALLDDLRALGHQVKRRDRQDKAQPGQGVSRTIKDDSS